MGVGAVLLILAWLIVGWIIGAVILKGVSLFGMWEFDNKSALDWVLAGALISLWFAIFAKVIEFLHLY